VIVLNYVFVWLDGYFRFFDSVVGLYYFSFFLLQHYTDSVLCLYVEPFLVGNEYLILGLFQHLLYFILCATIDVNHILFIKF